MHKKAAAPRRDVACGKYVIAGGTVSKYITYRKKADKKESISAINRFVLFFCLYMGLGLALDCVLTGQMRCARLVEISDSPLRVPPICDAVFSYKKIPTLKASLRAGGVDAARNRNFVVERERVGG